MQWGKKNPRKHLVWGKGAFKWGLKHSSAQSEQNSLTFPEPQKNSLTFQKNFPLIFPDARNPALFLFLRGVAHLSCYLWPVVAWRVGEDVALCIETGCCDGLIKLIRRLELGTGVLIPETEAAIWTDRRQSAVDWVESNGVHLEKTKHIVHSHVVLESLEHGIQLFQYIYVQFTY